MPEPRWTEPAVDTIAVHDTAIAPDRQHATRLFLLRVVRLMAIGGINDARGASMLINQFGRSYRRPLVLLRAMMLELARSSHRQIKLAPPCCGRFTRDEATLLCALSRAESAFAQCHDDACLLLDRDDALGAATCFQAVSTCFTDLGAPLA